MVLSALPATLPKDRFIERQPGTTAQPQVLVWDGLSSVIRLFWSEVTYLRGKRGSKLQWSLRSSWLSVLCASLFVRRTPPLQRLMPCGYFLPT